MYLPKNNHVIKIVEAIAENDWAHLRLGSNTLVFVTIVPSGSKLGWSTQTEHQEEKKTN